MSVVNPPSTPPRLTFDEPESEVNARFTATPVDSPRFTFQNLARGGNAGGSPTPSRYGSSTPSRYGSSTPGRYTSSTPGRYTSSTPGRWASPASTVSMYNRTPNRTPKMCMHGATCVKVRCQLLFSSFLSSFFLLLLSLLLLLLLLVLLLLVLV